MARGPRTPEPRRNAIVVGTDLSPRSRAAVRRATDLAARTGGRLVVAHIVPEGVSTTPRSLPTTWTGGLEGAAGGGKAGRARDERGALARAGEASVAGLARRLGDRVESKVRVGSAWEEILGVAEEEAARVIVMGVHKPRGVFESFFLGSTAERVLRMGRVPVLLVRSTGAGTCRKALVAVDLSDVSVRVLTVVRDLLPEAAITVAHVLPKGKMSAAESRERRDQARRDLEDLVKAAGLDPSRTSVLAVTGDPRTAILETADSLGVDLIAMGTQGRTGLARLLLGSVAEYVIRAAPMDILAVPPALR